MAFTIWQTGTGGKERSYSDIFLKHSVALIGPGDPGKWVPGKPDEDYYCSFVRHFATEIKKDHIIIAREGTNTIKAIGIVDSDEYLYLDQFADVKGWDLQHAKRVRWSSPISYTFETQVFGARPSRISRTYNPEVTDFVSRFLNSSPTDWQIAPLRELPEEEPTLDVPPEDIADLVALAKDMGRQYWSWGDCMPSESEMIAHFVIPLLYRLRWKPEEIAVEWHNVDIALFRRLPRTPENCHALIEAKRFGIGIESALDQVRFYAKNLGVTCPLFVTDGFRYGLYDTEGRDEPVVSANLNLLKKSGLHLFDILKRPPAGA